MSEKKIPELGSFTEQQLVEQLEKWKEKRLVSSHTARSGVIWHGPYDQAYLLKCLDDDMLESGIQPEHVAAMALAMNANEEKDNTKVVVQ